MSDNIIRELLKAEAPKTIAKEQIFVYVPEDYKDAVARIQEDASRSAEFANLSKAWATGQEYKATASDEDVTITNPDLYFASTGFDLAKNYFYKDSNGNWYIGDESEDESGHFQMRVNLADYGIEVNPESSIDHFVVEFSDSDKEGFTTNNAKYYAEQAGVAKEAAESAKTSAQEAETAAVAAKNSAVTAKEAAVAAKNAAETAQGNAESARDIAVTAKNDAETARDEAVSAKGSAEYARDEAAQYLEEMGDLYQAKLDKKPNGSTNLIDSGTGKITTSYLPDAILGQVEFQGTFNAATGARTPSKTFVAKEGYYWICKTRGGRTPDGNVSSFVFEVGDWALILSDNPTVVWDKVDNTDAVASVNNKTGTVVLTAADIQNGSSDVASDIAGLENGLEEKLDNDAMALASLMQGSKGMSVDTNEDNTYVDVHPDMTGATPGQVWMVNEAGDSAKWADFEGGAFTPVQYGVTTYAEITAIIQSGKVPVLKNGNSVLYYNGVESGTGAYQFFSVLQTAYSEKATCSVSSVWSNFGQTLEQDVNKTATIGASSTDTQYPTAKATYTALNDIRKVAEGKCASYTVDETLTAARIKSDLTSYSGHAYYNGTDITESVLDGLYDSWIRNTEFASSSDTLSYGIDDFIAVEIPGYEGFILYNFGDMKTGDVLYVVGTGYPDRWASGDVSGGTTKTLYTLETVRKEAVGRTVTISPSQWSNNTATVTVMGVTATNIVICDASDPDVQATAQNTNTLTFTCTKTPTVSVTVKVVIL